MMFDMSQVTRTFIGKARVQCQTVKTITYTDNPHSASNVQLQLKNGYTFSVSTSPNNGRIIGLPPINSGLVETAYWLTGTNDSIANTIMVCDEKELMQRFTFVATL